MTTNAASSANDAVILGIGGLLGHDANVALIVAGLQSERQVTTCGDGLFLTAKSGLKMEPKSLATNSETR